MRVAFLGLGLIGGSVARALRASGEDGLELVAWTPSGSGPRAALADGVLDVAAATPEEALAGAAVIVLAASPVDCLTLLDGLGGPWRAALDPEATITDVASTKAAIVARATGLGLRFVGGHPMAGRETSGYAASTADLFVDRPWIVVPTTTAMSRDIDTVERLATTCRARPLTMDAATHDAAVAGISHLPLVLAAALVEAVANGEGLSTTTDRPFYPGLTAGCWRDMTRLARGDVAMGAGIAATNAAALADRIRDVQAVLDGWQRELEAPGGPDVAAVTARLAAARDRLGELD
jgi:prephenate dehydrogenase